MTRRLPPLTTVGFSLSTAPSKRKQTNKWPTGGHYSTNSATSDQKDGISHLFQKRTYSLLETATYDADRWI